MFVFRVAQFMAKNDVDDSNKEMLTHVQENEKFCALHVESVNAKL